MRTPRKSPAELRAAHAARQKRYRARVRQATEAEKREEQANAFADHVLGFKESPGIEPPPGTDVATLLRDRYAKIIGNMGDEALMNKDFAPGLGVALRSQDIIDKREQRKAKGGTADLAFAIIAMLDGRAVPQLSDGMTVDGEATEVLDDA